MNNQNKVKTYFIKKQMTNKQIKDKEGHYFEKEHYNLILNHDCNVYKLDDELNEIISEDNLLFAFRKNVFKEEDCVNAFNALQKHAQKKHNNRGSAGGLLKKESLPNYVKEATDLSKFRAYYIGKDGKKKKDHISNYVQSGIIGYFDRYDRNIFNKKKGEQKLDLSKIKPCRMTQFTRDQVEKWKYTLPLINSANDIFKELVPQRHQNQLLRAKETSDYQILDTAFSTITINYNYQTATHKDKGDYESGFGNLIVLEKSKCVEEENCCEYEGGYLGFPQYKVAVDIRQGDFLAMDVHEWHCNTSLNLNTKTNQKTKNYGRLSMVCYLRKNMIKCK